MKKITVLALHLGYGGIEKIIANLVNSLADEYEINIISTYKLYETPIFEIDKRVKIEYLMTSLKPNKKEVINSIKKLNLVSFYKETKKAIKILKLKKKLMINKIKECDSDYIISTRDIHNEWLGKYGKKTSVKIGWEHNHHNNDQKYINKIVSSVKELDYFVLVSKSLQEFYSNLLKDTNCKCIYIPNSIDEYPLIRSKVESKNIISVGRLSKEKGFLDLIDVFNIVHQIKPDWHLDIVGDGPMREKIEEKINHLKLNDFIKLHGFQKREYINNLLINSSIYTMTSYTESFGIVLLEAFSYGLPCVAFDSAVGATEIIDNNWNGYLISNRDKEQFAKRICELISNKNRRIIMGNNGSKKAHEYDSLTIKDKWLELFSREK